VVALKVLRRTSPSELYGFKQEFRSLAGIEHPNLVTLYELLFEGERWFFSMEFVPSTDFLTHVRDDAPGSRAPLTPDETPVRFSATLVSTRDLVEGATASAARPAPVNRPQPFSLDRLLRALSQLAEGLMALHAAGIVHRDLFVLRTGWLSSN
jgi:serine/threonine protein kinase